MKLLEWWKRTSLIVRISIGLASGVALALLCPGAKAIGLLGIVFVAALKAIAPLLVAVLVTASVARAEFGMGRRFRTVIFLYLTSTLVAAGVAVCASRIFPVSIRLQDAAECETPGDLVTVFSNLLASAVTNPVAAVAEANYLGVLFWSILTGLAMRKFLAPNAISAVSDFADAISKVVQWIIRLAPLGILGLVFTAVSENGVSIFIDYGRLILLLVGCMLFTALVINPFIVALSIKGNPYPLVWKSIRRSGLSAFFTRSSAAEIHNKRNK